MKSFSNQIESILSRIIASDQLHAKWLNTLSYLENCGARMIAACEHPTLVKEEVLKHAAEEFRHAHYLKRQVSKITQIEMKTYAPHLMLGSMSTLQYLKALDVKASQYLKKAGLPHFEIKQTAYLLVTYAIERRAEELYPIYDRLLRQTGSRITVKSILLEEQEHLNEMIRGIEVMDQGWLRAREVCRIESSLCAKWLSSLL